MYFTKRSLYIFFAFLIPSEALARGSLHLEVFLYAGLFLIGVYLWLTFLGYFLSIPFFVFRIFDKNIREELLMFASGGFWYTFAIPIIIFLDLKSAKVYDYVVPIILWLFLWYIIAKLMQYKEDKWNKNL